MKISVVIPAYNEEKYIGACLESLMKQTEKPDEIIVIDNNSTDATATIAKSYGATVILEKKQGRTAARNRGFDSAKGDIILRTDADTRVPKNWVRKMKKHFIDPSVIAVSGPSKYYNVPSLVQVKNWPMQVFFRSFKRVFGHACLYGPNMAVRKSAWKKVRPELCDDDSVVHEDVDVAIHIAPFGKIVFDPKLLVECSARRWKRPAPYLEYPYRYVRTLQRHKQSLHGIKAGAKMIGSVAIRPTKRLLRFARNDG